MNIQTNIPIERQTTATLRHLMEDCEKGVPRLSLRTLESEFFRSLLLRGLRAEIESRSHVDWHNPHNPVIKHH